MESYVFYSIDLCSLIFSIKKKVLTRICRKIISLKDISKLHPYYESNVFRVFDLSIACVGDYYYYRYSISYFK